MLIGLIALIAFLVIWKWTESGSNDWKPPNGEVSNAQRNILLSKVPFYGGLNPEKRKDFERRVLGFLANCKITGIKTDVSDEDRILIAASAIMPIFSFPEWKYYGLKEVLLYPNAFNENFQTDGEGRSILGMVGEGYMDGKMILSKKALHEGFRNTSDKQNTAVHEFIHLIDKADGSIDGIPKVLLENESAVPWVDLIRQKMAEIQNNESDIRAYGGPACMSFSPFPANISSSDPN